MNMQRKPLPDILGNNEYMTFRRGLEEYGIAISRVRKVQELRRSDATPVPAVIPGFIQRALKLDGISVPLIDMRVDASSDGASSVAIMLHHETSQLAVAVDNIPEVVTLLPGHISHELTKKSHVDTKYVKGVAELGERKLILLDVEKLVEHFRCV